MQKWERALFQMAGTCGAFFAWLIAIEVGMLPASSHGDGVLFRWQVWLLASLVLVATRDFVSQVQCRCCGSREQISPLRLLPLRELLCQRCLSWDTGALPVEGPVLAADSTPFAGLSDALKPFWMRRPNKTWLPALWVSTSRTYLRRWAGLKEEKQA